MINILHFYWYSNKWGPSRSPLRSIRCNDAPVECLQDRPTAKASSTQCVKLDESGVTDAHKMEWTPIKPRAVAPPMPWAIAGFPWPCRCLQTSLPHRPPRDRVVAVVPPPNPSPASPQTRRRRPNRPICQYGTCLGWNTWWNQCIQHVIWVEEVWEVGG